jgi:hypothetical protein
MLSRAWHPVINTLSNQEAGLKQQALDTNQQLPLASTPTWAWNLGRPIPGPDWFSRYISILKTRTEMVLETLVFSLLNHLTQLVAWEYFIIQCRHESYKSYKIQSFSASFWLTSYLLIITRRITRIRGWMAEIALYSMSTGWFHIYGINPLKGKLISSS